ncbi:MAG: right-handed parallel beta-helix repeat-containing protein [Bacteroidota bacterium]
MKQLLPIFVLLFFTNPFLRAQTIYVNGSASGNNDGGSWTDAFTTLDGALAAANSGDAIWLAAGTYVPDSTFTLSTDVRILGGFAGTETGADQADPATNLTVLSGDKDGDDIAGEFNMNRGDNGRIMFIPDSLSGTVVLSGLNFRGGQTEETPEGEFIDDYSGGAILAYGQTEITACNFVENVADFGAGVAFLGAGAAGSTLSDISADDNLVYSLGVVYSINSGSITVRRSSFNGNTMNRGCIYATSSDGITVDSCTFTGNSAFQRGTSIGAVRTTAVTVTNCIFTNNFAQDFAPGIYLFTDGETPADPNDYLIENCIFQGNTSDERAGAIYLVRANSTIRNCIFQDNTATQFRGGSIYFFDEGQAHVLENCIFQNNNSGAIGNNIYQQGLARLDFKNCQFSGNGNLENTADGGAISIIGNSELSDTPIEINIDSCTFSQNQSNEWGGALFVQGQNTLVDLNISNTEFFGNNSASLGGVMYARSAVQGEYDNVTFAFNDAAFGGALYLRAFPVVDSIFDRPNAKHIFRNSSFILNSASGQGGAIDVRNADTEFYNCVFSKNLVVFGEDSEDAGGGGAIIVNGDSGIVTTSLLVNNTFFENISVNTGDDITGFLTDDGPAGGGSVTVTMLNNAFTSQGANGNATIEAGQVDLRSMGGNFFSQIPEAGLQTPNDIVDEDADPEEFYLDLTEDEELDFSLVNEDGDNPLVDAGMVNDSVPTTDFAGRLRDATPDIGAHEFVMDVSTTDIESSDLAISFFPNPIKRSLNIRLEDPSLEQLTVSLINLQGQLLRSWQLQAGTNRIDLGDFPAASYTLEILVNGRVYSKQLVKL